MLRALVVALSLCSTFASAQAVLLDRVVAFVDGEPILHSQLRARMKPGLARATTEEARQRLARESLDELIDDALVARDAEAMHLEISPEAVTRALADVAAANGLSAEQLEQELVKQGYTLAGYRRAVRQQLLAMRWVQLKLVARPDAAQAQTSAWLDAERRRLVQALRDRATIEVRP